MARWSSASFLDRELAGKGDQDEEEGWRRCGGRKGRGTRVSEGIRSWEIKREGKVVWWRLLLRGPQEHAPLVLAWRRGQGSGSVETERWASGGKEVGCQIKRGKGRSLSSSKYFISNFYLKLDEKEKGFSKDSKQT
jgi:hypothetical protein